MGWGWGVAAGPWVHPSEPQKDTAITTVSMEGRESHGHEDIAWHRPLSPSHCPLHCGFRVPRPQEVSAEGPENPTESETNSSKLSVCLWCLQRISLISSGFHMLVLVYFTRGIVLVPATLFVKRKNTDLALAETL